MQGSRKAGSASRVAVPEQIRIKARKALDRMVQIFPAGSQ